MPDAFGHQTSSVCHALIPDLDPLSLLTSDMLLPRSPFAVGDSIEAVQGLMWGKTEFRKGEVVAVRPSEKAELYDIRFDSGEVEELVDRTLVRRVTKATATPPRVGTEHIDRIACSSGRSIIIHRHVRKYACTLPHLSVLPLCICHCTPRIYSPEVSVMQLFKKQKRFLV